MRKEIATPDAMVGRIAARQHGAVAVRQLIACGLSPAGITRRVRAGRLHRVHRGVYAVGHPGLSNEGRWMAAVLSCGGPTGKAGQTVLEHWGAAVSHRSAAELLGLLPPGDGPVEVSVPGDGGRARRRGIRLHRSLSLSPGDVTLWLRIPVTGSARTIADLRAAAAGRAPAVSGRELRRAIRQAEVIGLPTGMETDRTRSDLEGDFLRLCRRHRLPMPEVGVRIGPHLIDFLWRKRRLAVETDGYLYHRGRAAYEDDRARDLDLRRRGYDVIRLSESQVDAEPEAVAEILAAAVGKRAA